MSDPRVIKKYPNRRLYDTVESRYITLADVRKLVVDRIDFVVIDKKSQNDITRSILLQVIADQEHTGEPVMSRDFLSHIIRTYGGSLHSMIGSYLEQSVKLFVAPMRDAASSRMTLERHLRRALDRDELHVVYQPVVDISDASIVGMEALLRWQCADLGPVSPLTVNCCRVLVTSFVMFTACTPSLKWSSSLRNIVASSVPESSL